MEPTLFSFIWKHSRRQQLWLLILTLLSFPFLYASLELPKKIVNDAIGAVTDTVTVYGIRFGQVEYLMLLCGLFLVTVLIVSFLFQLLVRTGGGGIDPVAGLADRDAATPNQPGEQEPHRRGAPSGVRDRRNRRRHQRPARQWRSGLPAGAVHRPVGAAGVWPSGGE